jgi:hypothetical protein
MRSAELQARINAALAVCDEMVARELGRIDTKPRQRRATRVRATPDSPKLRALKAYRKAHPGCSLRQAAGNVIERTVTLFFSIGTFPVVLEGVLLVPKASILEAKQEPREM